MALVGVFRGLEGGSDNYAQRNAISPRDKTRLYMLGLIATHSRTPHPILI